MFSLYIKIVEEIGMKKLVYLLLALFLYYSSYSQSKLGTHSITVNPGWNLLSLPAKVVDSLKSSLFPNAESSAFIYDNGYYAKDTLQHGYGFWVKFNSRETIPVTGNILFEDTIAVKSGWSLIGSLTMPIDVNAIISDPPNIISSKFYGYNNGYKVVDTLQPGFGYWVKVNQNGKIILNSDSVQSFIPENTLVIDDSTYTSNLISISPDSTQFTFMSSMDSVVKFKVDDIFVSTDGEGMLRKVTNVERNNDQIVVSTTDASLTEAIAKGNGSYLEDLTVESIDTIDYFVKGVVLKKDAIEKLHGKKAITFSIDAIIYDHDGNEETTGDQIKTTGTFEIGPTVRGTVVLDRFQLKKLQLEYEFVERLNQTLDIALFNFPIQEYKKTLAKIRFKTFTVMVGSVPVVITPVLYIKVGANIELNGSISTGVYQEYTYTTGLKYENNEWSTYADKTSSFDYVPPTVSVSLNAELFFKPELEFKIYGVLAPYLYGKLYGEFNSDIFADPWWELYAGLELGAGVRMKIFKKELFDYYGPLIQLKTIIAQSGGPFTNNPPSVPSDPFPSDNATGQTTSLTLSWSCSDPDNDSLTYDVYFGTDNPPATVVSSIQSDTSLARNSLVASTTYFWKVVAKDSYGDSASGPIWRFTTVSGGGSSCVGTPTVDYEGKTYNTVQIGSQCWLRENLDVGSRIDGSQNQTNNSTIEKYCYNNDPNNCNTYGGLYQWGEAMQYSTTEGARGICPTGWHIPTYAEFQTLSTTVGGDGNALKEIGQGTGTGAGTNTSGFSALLSGYRGSSGTFYDLGYLTFFWSSTEDYTSYAYVMSLSYNSSNVYFYYGYKASGFSVRCLMD